MWTPTTTWRAEPSPEHYHLIYNVPKDNISIPHWAKAYITSKEGYEEVYRLGKAAEPNVEWYDDGTVGLETRLHGRADLWWIVVEVAACVRSGCAKVLAGLEPARRFITKPELDDVNETS